LRSLDRWLELRDARDQKIRMIQGRTPRDAVANAHAAGVDLLIIDTPPALINIIRAGIAVGDFVLIPCKPSPVDVEAVDASVELSQAAGKPFAFVLTVVPTQGGAGITKGCRKFLNEIGAVLTTEINNRISYVGAMATGQTGADLDDKCKAEIKSLWAEVRKRLGTGK
jgi:chromosome partitioning protein